MSFGKLAALRAIVNPPLMKLKDFSCVSYPLTLSRFCMFLAFLHATRVFAQCKWPEAPAPCRDVPPLHRYFNGDYLSNSPLFLSMSCHLRASCSLVAEGFAAAAWGTSLYPSHALGTSNQAEDGCSGALSPRMSLRKTLAVC